MSWLTDALEQVQRGETPEPEALAELRALGLVTGPDRPQQEPDGSSRVRRLELTWKGLEYLAKER